VNQPLLNTLHPADVDVVIQRADEAEVDAMWSFMGKKTAQRWLWHAIDHHTGKVLAYVCGRRQDQVFLQRTDEHTDRRARDKHVCPHPRHLHLPSCPSNVRHRLRQ
jgi:IS1 transposase